MMPSLPTIAKTEFVNLNNQLYAFWISNTPQPYEEACQAMLERCQQIYTKEAPQTLWFLEHLPVFTAGRRTQSTDHPTIKSSIPVVNTERGGKLTYHGPGQLIVYVMLDLRQHKDVHAYLNALETWLINSLKMCGIPSHACRENVGLWTFCRQTQQNVKIASFGLKISKWITAHGLSLNINPDLTAFNNIQPCGLQSAAVSSLHKLGYLVTKQEISAALKHNLQDLTAFTHFSK